MRPRDAQNLQEEITELRHHINSLEEEKKLLKANSDKYERRAKYTLEKFHEIKAKELQLIQMGEQKMIGQANLIETKYKKKVAALN
jgi:predicted ribosome quality control (RQC) complex YloA/Tae2 family protein